MPMNIVINIEIIKKKNKAIFIGNLYADRAIVAERLSHKSNVDIYDNSHFHGEDYF